MLNTSYFVGT